MINSREHMAVSTVEKRLKQLFEAIELLEDVAMERVNVPLIAEVNKFVNSEIVARTGRGTKRHKRICDIRRRMPGLDLQMAMLDVSPVCLTSPLNNEAHVLFRFRKDDEAEMYRSWAIGSDVHVCVKRFDEYTNVRAAHQPAIGIGGGIKDGIELMTVGIHKSQPYRIIGPRKGVALDGSGEVVNIDCDWSRTHPVNVNCHVLNRLATGQHNLADAYLFVTRIWPLVRPRASLPYNDRTALHKVLDNSTPNTLLFNAVLAKLIENCPGVSDVVYNESQLQFKHSGYNFRVMGNSLRMVDENRSIVECTEPEGFKEAMEFINQYLKGSNKNA